MKKVLNLALIGCVASAVLALTSCGSSYDLLILNWNDYMSDDVISSFEKEYNLKVKQLTTDSNEQMYSALKNETAQYDLVVPSDYMVDQMAKEKMLKKLDFSKIEGYSSDMFVPELVQLMNSEGPNSYKDYYVPYFWGSLGIMYNTNKEGLKEAIMKNEWACLFEEDARPEGCKVGMYKSSRDAIAAAELYKGYSLNTTNKEEIKDCMSLLKTNKNKYTWDTDGLKIKISKNELDLALVYSGDFFDAYYADVEAGHEENTKNYDIYAPLTSNNVFFDTFVIPTTSKHEDNAYKFLSYILSHDNSLTNVEAVGYCPTVKSVYDEVFSSDDWSDITAIDAYNPVNVIKSAGVKAEVYGYLGQDIYSYIEEEFTKVLA